VAVCGFDDLDFASQLDPPLTTVRQGVGEIGHEAARTLLGLLEDPDGGPRRVLLPTELVVRQSTAAGSGGRQTESGSRVMPGRGSEATEESSV
jgi:DNA-binding LacI/PurR family transcriptional regulator